MQLTDSFVLLVLVLLLPPREEARLAAAHLAALNEQAEQGAHLCPSWVTTSEARVERSALVGFLHSLK